MENKERGAIVIEASLALPVFMFVIFTLLSIVNICYTQAKMGVALNLTAKEISQYTYLYGLTGLNEKHEKLYSDSSEQRSLIDETISGVGSLYSAAGDVGESMQNIFDNPTSLAGEYDEVSALLKQSGNDLESIVNNIDKVVKDPKTFMIGCGKILGNEVANDVKTVIGGELARVLIQKHLVSSQNDNCEAFLKRMRVLPKGDSYIKGLNFYVTEFLWNGTNEIELRVRYKVKVLDFFGLNVTYEFEQCGSTLAWFADNEKITPANSSEEGPSGEETTTKTEETTRVEETTTKSIRDYIAECSVYRDTNQVMLDSESEADLFNMTYLDLSRLNELTEGEKAEIKKEFIKQQMKEGKIFYFSSEPSNSNADYVYLKSRGYRLEFDEGVKLWRMIKM